MEITKDINNLITKVSEATGLLFVENKEPSNVCFSQKNELLRHEFKTVFTRKDLEYYIKGVSLACGEQGYKIPFNSSEFWQSVDLGKEQTTS